MRARTMTSLSATKTLGRGMTGYLHFVRSGDRKWNEPAGTVISNNFCLFDHAAGVIVVEGMAAKLTEELVILELGADEVAGAKRADDLEQLFGHVNPGSESPRIRRRFAASTTSIDESFHEEF